MPDSLPLIRDLLGSDAISADTRAELEGFEREATAGSLHREDAEYVAALHRRLIGEPGDPATAPPRSRDDMSPVERALAVFDALYHPDRGASAIPRDATRDAVWQEFRAELDRLSRED